MRARSRPFVPAIGRALLVSLLGGVTACGWLLDIQELSVDDAGGGPAADASEAAVEASEPHDASEGGAEDVADSGAASDASPDGSKVVFVTEQAFRASQIGGVESADQLCKDEARDGGLEGGAYRAWLATEDAGAIARIEHPGYYVRPDGRVVVTTRAELANGLLVSPINVTARLRTPTGDTEVWTGTKADGTQTGIDCVQWSSDYFWQFIFRRDHIGSFGDRTQSGPRWTTVANRRCDAPARLYCFEH